MPTCVVCTKILPITAFYVNGDRLRPDCKSCKREQVKQHRVNNPELIQRRNAQYYAENKDSILQQKKDYHFRCRERIGVYKKLRYASSKFAATTYAVNYRIVNAAALKEKSALYRQRKHAEIVERVQRREINKKRQTPKWVALRALREVYELADTLRRFFGVDVHVDHVIPINGVDVCGLHVPWNLRIVPARENIVKKNRWQQADGLSLSGTYEIAV